jgi:phosphoribosylglycinamide formyltransferase 2
MTRAALARAHVVAEAITSALGGFGIFGVELFIKGDDVYFNEVSPRPHDTGMVTMLSQELSEFALHVRAILGFPVPAIIQKAPGASVAILGSGVGSSITYHGLAGALVEPGTEVRVFGKPEINGKRRLAVALASADSVDAAREKALAAAKNVRIDIS